MAEGSRDGQTLPSAETSNEFRTAERLSSIVGQLQAALKVPLFLGPVSRYSSMAAGSYQNANHSISLPRSPFSYYPWQNISSIYRFDPKRSISCERLKSLFLF